jgi:hypothetical protein
MNRAKVMRWSDASAIVSRISASSRGSPSAESLS